MRQPELRHRQCHRKRRGKAVPDRLTGASTAGVTKRTSGAQMISAFDRQRKDLLGCKCKFYSPEVISGC